MRKMYKGTFSAWFRANRPKLCGNCAYPQNCHTRKSGEITAFYAREAIRERAFSFWLAFLYNDYTC